MLRESAAGLDPNTGLDLCTGWAGLDLSGVGVGAADSARPSDPSAALSLFCDPAASRLGNQMLLTCLTTSEEG
jgi:hypothetical protein